MRLFILWACAALGVCAALGLGAETNAPSNVSPSTVPSPSENQAISAPPPMQSLATPMTQPATMPPVAPTHLKKVVVTSDLDLLRDEIVPSLGATTYTLGPNQIQNIPEGENTSFYQTLLRAPGVVIDSFGQEHVRGEHANTTYDVDGVLLPQPINTFGQELDTHMVQSVTLIDGSLPAQYGFHTAGIIDVTSKTGAQLQGGEVSLYGGQFNTFIGSVELGWNNGKWDFFTAGTVKQDSLGIENPMSTPRPIHDDTDQQKLFIYAAYHIDDTSRFSFFVNASNADFQIPNVADVPPAFTFGTESFFNSADLNENQNEQEYYGVASYQKSTDEYSVLASAFYRYGQLHFTPDPIGDMIMQGVASEVLNTYATDGFQIDSSYHLNDQNIVRAGAIADYTVERNDTNTDVFPIDPVTGLQTSTTPENIVDNTHNHALEAGLYLQDEWKITKTLTLNFGGRLDEYDANYDYDWQISPRVNLVWKATDKTTFHVGYSRYFVPPPVQYVPPSTIAKFANTTNAPLNTLDDSPQVEKSDYYDIGVSQQITKPWLVNLDAFYKEAHELVDLGQFGAPVIFTPFNYQYGRVYGAEFSSTYKQDGFSAFANFAWVSAMGKNINSQQFTIDPAELAYISSNFIDLDHESIYTASAGASYDFLKDNEVYVDWTFGSGLRTGFANLLAEQSYYPVNIGYIHTFRVSRNNEVKLRFDIINVFDEVYQLRSGTGIGVEAPQYGQRRTFLAGLSYVF
jgi:outer membrane receptor protein involved in Fe transport